MHQPRPWIGSHDGRKLLKTGLLVLALLFQGFVGAAHVHSLALSKAGQATALASGLPGSGDVPATDQPANLPDGHNADCFVCHLTGMAAASLVPAALMVLPITAGAAPVLPGDDAPVTILAEHRSPRGPPITFVQS